MAQISIAEAEEVRTEGGRGTGACRRCRVDVAFMRGAAVLCSPAAAAGHLKEKRTEKQLPVLSPLVPLLPARLLRI